MSEDNGGGRDAPECLKDFLTANDEHNAKKEAAKGDSKPAETEMATKVDGTDKAGEAANEIN